MLKTLKEQDDTFSEKKRENSLLEELWFNLEGSQWKDLQKTDKFTKQKPDQFSYLETSETKRNIGDSYGRKIRAFLNPPEDGEYTFWLMSDDSSILQIAKPESGNFKKVAEIESHTGYSWNASVRSEKIFLRKQNSYEIQIIHKEGGGEDFCALGWTLPSGKEEKPINGKYFSAPLSTKDSPNQLNMQQEIRQKFENILLPTAELETSGLDNLAIVALEYSFLFMEKFDAYARSLINQNVSAINDGLNNFESFSRIDRATRLLAHPTKGILEEFRDTHILEIRNLSENATEVLWDNFSETKNFDPQIKTQSPYTDLSKGILSSMRVEEKENENDTTTTRGAALLISDGGHNRENSPLETAKLLAVRNLPIYTVGLGSDQNPPDLALLQTVVPDSVYQEDRISGILSLKDNLSPGTEYKISIQDSKGQKVWEKDMIGMENGINQLAFDFPAKDIVERNSQTSLNQRKKPYELFHYPFKLQSTPLKMKWRLKTIS